LIRLSLKHEIKEKALPTFFQLLCFRYSQLLCFFCISSVFLLYFFSPLRYFFGICDAASLFLQYFFGVTEEAIDSSVSTATIPSVFLRYFFCVGGVPSVFLRCWWCFFCVPSGFRRNFCNFQTCSWTSAILFLNL
jgi:hypothetical protein